MTNPAFRGDIQALRGLAISAVVLYHAAPRIAAGGYLGVDIFFVISGFLIGGVIARDVLDGRFELIGFYFRRARRLLPAAYATFACTALLSSWLLTEREFRDFQIQLVGALTFTSNMVIPRQSGYFQLGAELKPLLHTWSLALEEQFYVFLPLFFLATPRRMWMSGLVLALISSFALYFYVFAFNPSVAFYYLPTRCWELLIGAAGSLLVNDAGRALATRLFWPAIVGLLGFTLFPVFSDAWPALDALIVCLSTLTIIIARREKAVPARLIGPMVWLGDISYPLYLVHWPILAFIRTIWIAGPPRPILAGAALLAIPLAWCMKQFIESPVRRWEDKSTRVRQLASFVAPATILSASIFLFPALSPRSNASPAEINWGLSQSCWAIGPFSPTRPCVTGQNPTILLWGDSLIAQFATMFASAPQQYLAQATMGACAPTLALAYVAPLVNQPAKWSEQCVDFNNSMIDYLKRTPSIEMVVLSTRFTGILDDKASNNALADGEIHRASLDLATTHFFRTLAEIRKLQRKIAIAAPFPSAAFNIPDCMERRDRGLLTFGVDVNCRINRTASERSQSGIRELLRGASRQFDIPIVDFDADLCGPEYCATNMDGVPLYYDGFHLSAMGSTVLEKKFGVAERILRSAR